MEQKSHPNEWEDYEELSWENWVVQTTEISESWTHSPNETAETWIYRYSYLWESVDDEWEDSHIIWLG